MLKRLIANLENQRWKNTVAVFFKHLLLLDLPFRNTQVE